MRFVHRKTWVAKPSPHHMGAAIPQQKSTRPRIDGPSDRNVASRAGFDHQTWAIRTLLGPELMDRDGQTYCPSPGSTSSTNTHRARPWNLDPELPAVAGHMQKDTSPATADSIRPADSSLLLLPTATDYLASEHRYLNVAGPGPDRLAVTQARVVTNSIGASRTAAGNSPLALKRMLGKPPAVEARYLAGRAGSQHQSEAPLLRPPRSSPPPRGAADRPPSARSLGPDHPTVPRWRLDRGCR